MKVRPTLFLFLLAACNQDTTFTPIEYDPNRVYPNEYVQEDLDAAEVAAKESARNCMFAAAASLDDGVSDVISIAHAVNAFCERERRAHLAAIREAHHLELLGSDYDEEMLADTGDATIIVLTTRKAKANSPQ